MRLEPNESKPQKVLILEQGDQIRPFAELVLKRKIREDHCRLHFAATVDQAKEILETKIDVLVLESDRHDGSEELWRFIEDRDLRVKAVVVSEYGHLEAVRSAMNQGAFDFITKPIDLKDLDITLTKALAESRRTREAERQRKSLAALEMELDIAQQLQRDMMPNLPFHFDHFTLSGCMRPSEKVGGDFWDVIHISDEERLIVFGDCSGHGLASALFMAAIRHSLLALTTRFQDYSDFIEPLNALIYREYKDKGRYATMMLIHLRKGDPNVRYLRAGHELAHHRRQGSFLPQDWRGGLPVGLFPHRQDDEWIESRLDPGDELILVTDGIVDGLPDHQPKAPQLLEEVPQPRRLADQGLFFKTLQSQYGWRAIDDATLLILSRDR